MRTISFGSQSVLGSDNTFTGTNTFTGRVLLADGTAAAPSLAFANDGDNGIYLGTGNGVFAVSVGGGAVAATAAGTGAGWGISSTGSFRWASTSDALAAADLILNREAAAILQLGDDVNGAAVAQAIKSHDGITGSNVAGADLTIAGGRGTGTGAAGNLRKQTAPSLASGTTAHTLADRELVVAKAKDLTGGAATGFVRIGCPQGTVIGGAIHYSIQANDATNYQCRAGVLPFAIVNPAGTEVGTVGTVAASTEVVAVSSGTLTNTFTISSNAADTMDILANAVSSLTETTLRIAYSVVVQGGTGTITPL